MWNTTTPALTPCFIDVVFVLFPVSLFWLAYPFLLCHMVNSVFQSIPRNCLNTCKLTISIISIIISGLQIIELFWLWNPNQIKQVPLSRLITLSVSFLTCFLIAIAFHLQRLFGFVNVGSVWLYLLAQTSFNVISIYFSYSLRSQVDMMFLYVQTALQVALFLFASFPEPTSFKGTSSWLPSDVRPDEGTNLALVKVDHKHEIPCPKESASFPSQLTFWWFNSLVYLGFRRPLTIDDLWQIRAKDRSEYCFWRFNCFWRHPVFKRDSGFKPQTQTEKSTMKISLRSILFSLFWTSFLFPNVARFVADMLQLASPMILKSIFQIFRLYFKTHDLL